MSEDKSETLCQHNVNPATDRCVLCGKNRFQGLPLPSSEGTVKTELDVCFICKEAMQHSSSDPHHIPIYLMYSGGNGKVRVYHQGCIIKVLEASAPLKSETVPTSEQLVIDLARELYDRFVMGGWLPSDAHQMIREMLMIHSETVPTEAAKPQESWRTEMLGDDFDYWINEDELPDGYPYDAMFPLSRLGIDGRGGCRIFPKLPHVNSESETVEERARQLIAKLDDIATDYNHYEYGLPGSPEPMAKLLAACYEFASSLLQEKERERNALVTLLRAKCSDSEWAGMADLF